MRDAHDEDEPEIPKLPVLSQDEIDEHMRADVALDALLDRNTEPMARYLRGVIKGDHPMDLRVLRVLATLFDPNCTNEGLMLAVKSRGRGRPGEDLRRAARDAVLQLRAQKPMEQLGSKAKAIDELLMDRKLGASERTLQRALAPLSSRKMRRPKKKQ